MKFSLEQTNLAYNIDDLDGLDILITDAIMQELEPESIDSVNLGNLEFAKSIVQRGKNYKQIKDMKLALRVAVSKMEQRRGILLSIIDSINRYLKKVIIYIVRLPRRFQDDAKDFVVSSKEDMMLYRRAREMELKAQLSEALDGYNNFANKYPNHEIIPLVKLRTAYTYQKLGDTYKAQSIYRKLIREYPLSKESDIARIQVLKLKRTKNLLRQKNILIVRAHEMAEDKEVQQEIYYQIAAVNTKLLDLSEAKKFYRRSFNANPLGSKSYRSRFNAAWVDKESYNLDLSAEEFLKIIEESPDGGEGISIDARYQVANIYQQEGNYQEAIDMYVMLAEDHKDKELASLCLFQAGASYLYDLNDQEKADEIFAKLKEEHPDSPYADFTSPDTSVGLFLTFVVPRASRVVTWRGAGLMCLSGYSGELVGFKIEAKEENFNKAFRDWLAVELPDTVGNIWVDIKDTEFDFMKDKFSAAGHIMMGKFEVDGEAEGYVKKTKNNSIRLVFTKAVIENIPIPPIFINMALSGIFLIVERYFPITITDIFMLDDVIYIEGFGGKRIINRIKKSAKNLLGVEILTEMIKGPEQQKQLYALFKEKFPWSDFSQSFNEQDVEELFFDFFTRMSLYASFKLLETVKDSKLDYSRSIRTLGRIEIKKEKFKFTFTEQDINSSLNMFVFKEFPWIIDNKTLFDIKGLEFSLKENGEIDIDGHLGIGQNIKSVSDSRNIRLKATINLEIDEESRIPYIVFREISLNSKPFPVEKVNALLLACLEVLKDGHIPLKLEEINISKEQIILKGEGADDFVSRVFSIPHLFVIFHIRDWDLYVAGIQKVRPSDYRLGDRWMSNLPDTEVRRILRERPGAIEEELNEIIQSE